MKNADWWRPSKYVFRRGKLVASRDPKEVSVASRLICDAVARLYDLHIKDHCRGNLLDLGCGKVPLYGAYKDFVQEITCVDWGATTHGLTFVDFECDLSRPLPFSAGEFDTVILSDVLEHVPEPAQLWSEISRILRTGGKCLLSVPFFYWIHEEPFDYYRYTEYALRRFAERTGFRVVLLESLGGIPEVLADLLAKGIAPVPLLGRCFAITFQAIVQCFGSTGFGKRISGRTSRDFPFGYFMVVEKT